MLPVFLGVLCGAHSFLGVFGFLGVLGFLWVFWEFQVELTIARCSIDRKGQLQQAKR